MTIMQMVVVACLGVAVTSGRSAVKPRKWNTGQGKMVIFTVGSPSENISSRKSSTRRRSERWFHLDRSYGWKVVKCRRSGTNVWINFSKQAPSGKTESAFGQFTFSKKVSAFSAEVKGNNLSKRESAFRITKGKSKLFENEDVVLEISLHLLSG